MWVVTLLQPLCIFLLRTLLIYQLDSTVYASMGVQLQPHHPHHGLTMPPQSHEVLLIIFHVPYFSIQLHIPSRVTVDELTLVSNK